MVSFSFLLLLDPLLRELLLLPCLTLCRALASRAFACLSSPLTLVPPPATAVRAPLCVLRFALLLAPLLVLADLGDFGDLAVCFLGVRLDTFLHLKSFFHVASYAV